MEGTETETIGDPRTFAVDAEIEVRSAAKRELDVRIVPWGVAIDTLQGREMFARGAFAGTDPDGVMLMGVEHEAHFGLGQDGRPVMTRHVTGKATSLDDREDGQHATFRVARTQAGDEILALAADKIIKGVSVEFTEVSGGTEIDVHQRAPHARPQPRPACGRVTHLPAGLCRRRHSGRPLQGRSSSRRSPDAETRRPRSSGPSPST